MSYLFFICYDGKGNFSAKMESDFPQNLIPEIFWFGKVYRCGQNSLFAEWSGAAGCSLPGVGVSLCYGLGRSELGISRYYGMVGCASCGLSESLGRFGQFSKHQVSVLNSLMGVTFSVSNT